jgi:uncharacterized protein YidB (DUF937 family)
MGLFDGLSNLIHEAVGAEAGQLAGPLMQTLEQQGVGDLVSHLSQNGLGAQVASWIGNGQNLPIDASTIQQVLGNPAIEAVAQKMGIDPAQASQLIATHLPALTQHLAQNAAPATDAPATDASSTDASTTDDANS